MKLIARFILIMFVVFLSTPTVVTLIQKNSDVSMFYSFTEEENHKEIKEVKAHLDLFTEYHFEFDEYQNSKIISENQIRHDNIAEEIFIPPPELI